MSGAPPAVVPADRGSATAELAAAMPVVIVLLVAGLTAVTTVTSKLGCVATARDLALALARGATPSIPDDADVDDGPELVTVTIQRSAIRCAATAEREP